MEEIWERKAAGRVWVAFGGKRFPLQVGAKNAKRGKRCAADGDTKRAITVRNDQG